VKSFKINSQKYGKSKHTHDICRYRKQLRKTNKKVPKRFWVHKKLAIPITDLLYEKRSETKMVFEQWMLVIHDGNQVCIAKPPGT